MKIGINETRLVPWATHYPTPDIFSAQALLLHVPSIQRTLSQDYVPGSNVLHLNEHAEPFAFPNDFTVQTCYLPSTAGRVLVRYEKPCRQSRLFLKWADSEAQADFESREWLAGHPVDFMPSHWANTSLNPADWLVEELILPGGRRTGWTDGLKPGQRIKTQVCVGKRPIPAGDWTVPLKGTGRVEFAILYRENTGTFEYASIDYEAGIASGPLTLRSECCEINIEVAESDPADPIHDGRIIMPGVWPADLDSDGRGYEGKSFAQIYAENPEPDFWLSHPDHVIDGRNAVHSRVIDQLATIFTPGPGSQHGVVDPSDRALPTLGFGKQSFGYGGAVPWEWLIEDAALCRQDLYITTGHEWSDATVLAFCDVFKDRAPAWMKLLVAHSCEPWNLFFAEYYACAIKGAARFHPRVLESITYNSGTGLATATKRDHGYDDGDTVQIHGTSESAYNGPHEIDVIDADTFRFTPNSAPTHSPSLPQEWGGAPASAFKVGDPGTFVVESIEFRFAENDPVLGTGSGFFVTTTEPVVVNGNVVAICNVDGTGVDNYYMAIRNGAMAPNQFFLATHFQCLHRPLLDPIAGPVTAYDPIPGREIVGAVVLGYYSVPGSEVAVQETIAAWHGYRTAHIFGLVQSKFLGELSRLVMVCEGFILPSYNRTVLRYALAEFGGKRPPVSETTLHLATYADSSFDQRAAFVGDCKPLASIVVSGGIATATIASYPIDVESGPNVTDHNWATGDQITIQAVSRDDCHGRFAILATPTASTFTFAVPGGVPDGPLSPAINGMFAIKDNTRGIIIVGVSRSGSQLTLTAPGHPFTTGQSICLMGFNTFRVNGTLTILSSTSSTFTVNIPGLAFTPSMDLSGRAAAFAASLTPIVGEVLHDQIENPGYIDYLVQAREVSGEVGATYGTYETGTHPLAKPYIGYVPWVGGAIMAGMRDPAMHAMTVAQMALHEAEGCQRFTIYSNTGAWSYDGNTFPFKEHQHDTLSRKWTGFVEGAATYGEPFALPGPATRFELIAPDVVRVGEYAGYGSVGPDGILSVDVTITFSADPDDGTFDPPALFFPAGTSSAQEYLYTPSSAGTRTLTAVSAPQLGEVAHAMSVTLDSEGNPGNATLLVDDSFDRADGPIGNGWIANDPGYATITSGKLALASSEVGGAQFTYIATIVHREEDVEDAQVVVDFIASNANIGALFRSNGLIGNSGVAYGVFVIPQSGRIQIYRFNNGGGLFYDNGMSESFVSGNAYRMVAKCQGETPNFYVRIVNLATDAVLFEAESIPHAGSQPAITGPGKLGILMGGGAVSVERIAVSELGEIADPDPVPTLSVTPATATASSGTNTVQVTATLVDSDAALSVSVAGGGSLSTNLPISGVGFTWTKPGTGSGTATITVTSVDDSLSDTCVITYSANSTPVVKLSGWLRP